MDKSELRKHLLDHDNNEIYKSDNEGFSSGYDSPLDPSDVDSIHENEADNIFSEDEDEYKDVIRFKNTSALCEQLKYILSMPELCDVSFLVGPNKIPVYGLKAVIGTRSRILYQMILDGKKGSEGKGTKKSRNNSRLLIEVKMYEPDDFRRIIQFVHCGSTDVSVSNVTGLLCGAYEFGLNDLKQACRDFIRRHLTSDVDSVLNILSNAQRYKYHVAASKLISKVLAHYTKISTPSSKVSSAHPSKGHPKVKNKVKDEYNECKGSRITTV